MAAANGQPGTAEAVLSVWAMARGAAGNAATDSQQLPMFGTAERLEGVIKRLLAIMQVWQCLTAISTAVTRVYIICMT